MREGFTCPKGGIEGVFAGNLPQSTQRTLRNHKFSALSACSAVKLNQSANINARKRSRARRAARAAGA